MGPYKGIFVQGLAIPVLTLLSLRTRFCILMNDIYDSQESSKRPYVCLMATFDGRPIEEMPRITGFFCIPDQLMKEVLLPG